MARKTAQKMVAGLSPAAAVLLAMGARPSAYCLYWAGVQTAQLCAARVEMRNMVLRNAEPACEDSPWRAPVPPAGACTHQAAVSPVTPAAPATTPALAVPPPPPVPAFRRPHFRAGDCGTDHCRCARRRATGHSARAVRAPAPKAAATPPAPLPRWPRHRPCSCGSPGGGAQPLQPLPPRRWTLPLLEQRLKDTRAIGVFTKPSLKNQVDDLLKVPALTTSGPGKTLPQLRQSYELLLLKVVSLVAGR